MNRKRSLLRNIIFELRWLRAVKAAWIALGVLVLSGVYGATQSVFHVQAAVTRFHVSAKELSASGGNVADALRQAVTVEYVDGHQEVANPVRFDYDAMQAAAGSLLPLGQVEANLTFLATVLGPLLFVVFGVIVGSHDRVAKTVRYRVENSSGGAVFAGKTLTLGAMSAAAVMVVSGLSLLSSFAVRACAGESLQSVLSSMTTDRPLAPVFALAVTTMAISWIWSLVGLIIGTLCRNYLIPVVAVLAGTYVIPLSGPFDIRDVETAWVARWDSGGGFFPPEATIEPSAALAVAWLAATLLALVVVSAVDRRRGYVHT